MSLLSVSAADTPAQHYREQAVAAMGDLINHFWTGMPETGHIVGTSHGLPTTSPKNERGILWERGMLYITLENLWQVTGDATLLKRLQSDWSYTKTRFSIEQLEACGQASGTNWAADDAGWSALMYLAAHHATGDADALARARGLVRASFNHWLDDQLGGGMWYSDKRDRKSLYQTALVLAALRIHELTGDEYFREQALKCYTWMETHLLREDGLYWCDYGAAGPFGLNRPQDIHEAGSVVFLGGNMAMGVLHARLFRATKDDKYRERALRNATALLKQITTAEGVFMDDRDAWTNGVFAGDWAREVLSLPGADNGLRDALHQTADSIFSKARTPAGLFGGSWSGPPEGEGSVWWKKKSRPEQIMTSANAVNMIVAACIESKPLKISTIP
jgi:predicted alpha-1,6-mannanase (GH76 family)